MRRRSRERERQPWFDRAGFLLHEVGGRLAGFCWTKVHEAELEPFEVAHEHPHRHDGDAHAHVHTHSDAAGADGDEDAAGDLGEIYVIAVDPDFQGRGLGRQLVLAGLESLAAKGVTTGMLYVDNDNASARALYRSLGFSDDHVDRAYVTDVASAAGPGVGEAP